MNNTSVKYSYVPLDELTTPREGAVLVDRWWLVDPEKGAIFYEFSPQCNSSKTLCESMRRRLSRTPPLSANAVCNPYDGAVVVFVPVAYIASRAGDRY